MAKITVLRSSDRYTDYHIEDERGWCQFSLWFDNPTLTSWQGSIWPGSFPEVFEHFGDPGVINCRSGYRVRDLAGLPRS